MQQLLPFTVLKRKNTGRGDYHEYNVATVLTVYGIETIHHQHYLLCDLEVVTVFTVYGIETGEPQNEH